MTDAEETDRPRRAQVIALANHKGGVGKTTTSVNLAAALTRGGYSTLLVDADAQAHATDPFVDDPDAIEADLYDVIARQMPIEKAIRSTRLPGLDLLPATLELAGLDLALVAMHRREIQVRRALEPIQDRYAYVVIDLPPSLALATVTCLAAADHIIAPVTTEARPVKGLGRFLVWTDDFRQQDIITAPLLGVLVTMYDRRTGWAQETLAQLKSDPSLRVFDSVIPRRIGVEDDAVRGLAVGDTGANQDVSDAYQRFAEEVVTRTGGTNGQ